MDKVVITVVGKDTVGIIAAICTYLAEQKVNILDISQTIVSGFFNMMMIVDVAQCTSSFDGMADGLSQVGQDKGVIVKCQREAIFEQMHRV